MPSAMVVDDSRVMRMILKSLLNKLGYEVETAGNGAEALEVLERLAAEPELVLVDWNMPVMNGLEFIRRVRAEKRFRPISLMMVTTETEAGQVVCALAAGANEYVMKPFTEEIITDKLRLLGLAD